MVWRPLVRPWPKTKRCLCIVTASSARVVPRPPPKQSPGAFPRCITIALASLTGKLLGMRWNKGGTSSTTGMAMTLRTRVMLGAVSTICLVVVALVAASWIAQRNVEARFWQATMTGKDALWRQIVSSQLDHMLANMSGLTRNAEVLHALQSTEPVVLAESAQPLYNRLRASQVLPQLQITDLNGLVRFSMPQALTGA